MGPGAALRGNGTADEQDAVVQLGPRLLGPPGRRGARGHTDPAFDDRRLRAHPYEGRVRAPAQQQAQAGDHHRLARAGLTRHRGESGRQLDHRVVDDPERPYPHLLQHGHDLTRSRTRCATAPAPVRGRRRWRRSAPRRLSPLGVAPHGTVRTAPGRRKGTPPPDRTRTCRGVPVPGARRGSREAHGVWFSAGEHCGTPHGGGRGPGRSPGSVNSRPATTARHDPAATHATRAARPVPGRGPGRPADHCGAPRQPDTGRANFATSRSVNDA